MRKLLVTLSVLLAVTTATVSADDSRRDGNWWLIQTYPTKVSYLVGFLDGMELGRNFTIWGLPNKKGQMTSSAQLDGATSYDSYVGKYLNNVTSGQIASGLDSFYSDYRNRTIRTPEATWLVLKSIAGEPPTEEVLNNWRKNAK